MYSRIKYSLRVVPIRRELRDTGSVILPINLLPELSEYIDEDPMLFRLDTGMSKFTHTGVYEFSLSDDDQIEVPVWIMKTLERHIRSNSYIT